MRSRSSTVRVWWRSRPNSFNAQYKNLRVNVENSSHDGGKGSGSIQLEVEMNGEDHEGSTTCCSSKGGGGEGGPLEQRRKCVKSKVVVREKERDKVDVMDGA